MAAGRFTGEALRHGGHAFDIFDAADRDGRPVVIKRGRSLAGLDILRFAREARLGLALRHRGLASVIDHGSDWIAFERLDGSSLDPPPRVRSLATLKEVADTLAHLHARGVVHRDLKPAHIMFRGDRAVLIDLGVAGLVGGGEAIDTGEIVGSPAWMAPEQMTGAEPAPAADIWSFCAVAYRLLAGRPLFAGSADAVLEQRRTGPEPSPDFSSLADRRLAETLRAGFAVPGNRPSARELAAALAEAGFGASKA